MQERFTLLKRALYLTTFEGRLVALVAAKHATKLAGI